MKKTAFLKIMFLSLIFICSNIKKITAHKAILTTDELEINGGTSKNLQNAISRLNNNGTTVIIVTHSLRDAEYGQ